MVLLANTVLMICSAHSCFSDLLRVIAICRSNDKKLEDIEEEGYFVNSNERLGLEDQGKKRKGSEIKYRIHTYPSNSMLNIFEQYENH